MPKNPRRLGAFRPNPSETISRSARVFIEAPLVRKVGPIPVRSLAPDIRQSFQQDDVGIALGDRGKDRAPVGRPGHAAGDERRAFPEIGNLTPLAGRCRERPDVGGKPVGQCLRQPLPVGRQPD